MQKTPNLIYSPGFNQGKAVTAQYLCIVGSSGSGKSTAVSLFRSLNDSRLEFPVRYVTRPPRPDDDSVENIAVPEQKFLELKSSGEILASWQKDLKNVGKFWYGIARPNKNDSLCVVSGNNAFVKAVSLPNTLIVEVWADEQTRRQRVKERGELSPEEIEARVQATDFLDITDIDVRIINNGGVGELLSALRKVINLKFR